MELSEIQKLKAYVSNEFNTNGDILYLTIKFNKQLRDLLKKACVLEMDKTEEEFYTGRDQSENTQYFKFKRYKAKTLFFKELQERARAFLYSVKLLDKGKIKIPFYSIYNQTDFLNNFQISLKKLIELLIGENIQREISFNLSE